MLKSHNPKLGRGLGSRDEELSLRNDEGWGESICSSGLHTAFYVLNELSLIDRVTDVYLFYSRIFSLSDRDSLTVCRISLCIGGLFLISGTFMLTGLTGGALLYILMVSRHILFVFGSRGSLSRSCPSTGDRYRI